jgi:CheY-like chemotaxis protein
MGEMSDLSTTVNRCTGINGIELYERLHEIPELEQIPAILLTASFPPRDRMRKLGLPLLQKPFDLDELLLAIEQLLH